MKEQKKQPFARCNACDCITDSYIKLGDYKICLECEDNMDEHINSKLGEIILPSKSGTPKTGGSYEKD